MRRFCDDRRRGRRGADRRRADRRRGRRRADHCRADRRALEHSQGARSSSTLLTWLQTLFAYYQFSDLRVLAPDEMRAALSQLHRARRLLRARRHGRRERLLRGDVQVCVRHAYM